MTNNSSIVISEHLAVSVRHLLLQRADVAGIPPESPYDWVATDPIVNFISPAMWLLSTERSFSTPKSAGYYWANIARFELLRKLASQIIAAFQQQNIDIILLKGILFAETLFDAPGLRFMNDLDLLVRSQDLKSAVEIFQTLTLSAHKHLNGWTLADLFQYTGDPTWQPGEWSFANPHGLNVDLHWHLSSDIWIRQGRRVDMEAIWTRAVPLPAEKWGQSYTLCEEDTLAYLCLHLALHGLQPLRAYLDVDQFIKLRTTADTWQWQRFVQRAEEWQIRSAAYHVFKFAGELLGTPLPPTLLQQLDPGATARFRVARLLQPADLLTPTSRAYGRRYPALVKIALLDQGAAMFTVAGRVLFPASEWRAIRYHGRTSLWYHWQHGLNVILRGD